MHEISRVYGAAQQKHVSLPPLRTAPIFPQVFQAFTPEHEPVNPVAEISLQIALDDLKWWSEVLEKARGNGQLPPAAFRIQAAAAAVNEVEDEAV